MASRKGLPYMGSKSAIAEWVLSYLPKAENFYDLFCGGCAITHCAITQGKYQNYYINDIKGEMPQAFIDCINGKYNGDYRWISHEDFDKLKGKGDMVVDVCFSFGNNWRKGYAYSRELEPYKKALHYAIFFDDYTLAQEMYGIDFSPIKEIKDIERKYAIVKKNIKDNNRTKCVQLETLERLQNLERLHRLYDLQNLERLHRLNITPSSLSYDEVEIKPNSVIYCFDKETEVLTNRGWINVADVTLNDKCLSREPNTGVLEWVNVVNLISYHYNGDMYHYEGKNVDLCVTPNHRMFVNKPHGRNRVYKDELIEASELFITPNGARFISANGVWNREGDKLIDICGFRFDKKDFAYLLGLFLTDGSVNNQGAITISQTKRNVIDRLIKTLNSLGVKYNIYENKRSQSKTFYIQRSLLPFFKQFYKKENRRIPCDIKNWSSVYLQHLLDGLLDGNSDKERRRLVCGAKGLLDDVQEICYKIGLSANIREVQPKTSYLKSEDRYIVGKKPYYVLSINHKPYLSIFKKNTHKVKYDDVVNCVTLDKWHTVLVRRNGKPIWCGQCDIPYRQTSKYNEIAFDYDKFYDWCLKQTEPLFISEYEMPESDFVCIGAKSKVIGICATDKSSKAVEKIFVPKHQYKDTPQLTLF